MRTCIRIGRDVVARLGGDEFAVLLPEVGPVGTKTVAERLLRAIRELVPPVEGMQIAGEKITVSMGLAALTEEIENWHELVKAADQSLYQAKIAGRNRMGEILSVSETTDHQKQIPNS